ncbi:hypothetical protein VOLCADRAFT_105533 [Volvox carteri f. nagariensis]|uniref:Jacalin-type lectin domain-containing protein n=1 Tax=Volvox carteri f. nagariensis TaxID=3068 RepID=D8U1F4_VOLCA|nr:uncharacterized protein VOLCADRAFT_105533 [Volvox carteri f. nagariensis]EFJ46405.1 hypothetical protein VOLCADRAFT_105533 [Volvox carteri f. nagariensis]|eukprot:XP_002952558.1 hypothetical protein VOLCADRAFT_105533 [Volvox carteri f. nagariensis]
MPNWVLSKRREGKGYCIPAVQVVRRLLDVSLLGENFRVRVHGDTEEHLRHRQCHYLFYGGLPHSKPTAAQLAAIQARANALRDKAKESPSAAKAVSEALAAAMSTVPPISLARGLRALRDIPHDVQAHLPDAVELLAVIRGLGVAPPCLERPGAPRGLPGRFRYMIAANLKDCEALMPYWTLEVLRLGFLLQGNSRMLHVYFHNVTADEVTAWSGSAAHVSVYESGSKDSTPTWLRIAESLWQAAGMKTSIVVNGPVQRGLVLDPFSGRYSKQHKVQYAAALRNAALEPLYNSPSGTYNYVIFLNDVFFCAPDFLRLTHFGADIACGLDFEVLVGDKKGRVAGTAHQPLVPPTRRLLDLHTNAFARTHDPHLVAEHNESAVLDILPGRANWHSVVKRMTQVHADEATRQAEAEARVQEAQVKPRYEFYDTWVSKDLGGNPFIKEDPLARDTRTIDLLHRGLPVPVKCCWNGGALINATMFYAGVRFRSGLLDEGECDISECSLLCEDFRRMGAKRAIIDPSVRVSYAPWAKASTINAGVGPKMPWSHVERSGALERLTVLWTETTFCMSTQCVPMRKDGSELPDIHNFRVIDLGKTNFTNMFIERSAYASPPPPKPDACNLIMGPYGDTTDGSAFDDLAYASWGKSPITRIYYRAGTSATESMVYALKLTYGSTATVQHGSDLGEAGEYELEAGEQIIGALVQFDETTVFAISFETNRKRSLTIGAFREGVAQARANPCPAAGSRFLVPMIFGRISLSVHEGCPGRHRMQAYEAQAFNVFHTNFKRWR